MRTTGIRYVSARSALAIRVATNTGLPIDTAPIMIFALLTNPTKNGKPAMPIEAAANAVMVTGMRFPTPIMSVMSFLWVVTNMAPAAMKRVIFMKAWATMWYIAPATAYGESMHMPSTMYESCPTVEYASLALRFVFCIAMREDSIIVNTAIQASTLVPPHDPAREGPNT